MKKTLTVLIAAGALLGVAACSAPSLSNEETCARIQNVAAPKSGTDKPGMVRLANQIRPIEATASEALKAPLQSIVDFLDESTKEHADNAKLQQLQAEYTSAFQKLNEVCGQ
jgi:ABC-type glycerol-3-phosphate transport system substrate-binding protein